MEETMCRKPNKRFVRLGNRYNEKRILTYGVDQPMDDAPDKFPHRHELFVLVDCVSDRPGPFLRLVEWMGWRFLLLLEHNEGEEHCAENLCLQKVYDAEERNDGELYAEAKQNCMKLFWKVLENEHKRLRGSEKRERSREKYEKDSQLEVARIQLKTIKGKLVTCNHMEKLDIYCQPIPNTFSGVPVFSLGEVEFVTRTTERIDKVIINGDIRCLKRMPWLGHNRLRKEISHLQRAIGIHPSIICLIGILEVSPGMVGGIVLPYVEGAPLMEIKGASKVQKEAWKEQICSAVERLHKAGLVWGDAKAANVLIEQCSSKPILIDFEGGYTLGWVDDEAAGLELGDEQGLLRICELIDEITELCD